MIIEYSRLIVPGINDVESIGLLLGHLDGHTSRVHYDTICEVAQRSYLYVARDLDNQKRIVSMATLIPRYQLTGFFGFIEDVATYPDYEGRGIVTALMQYVHDRAREMGIEHLDLTSRPEREAANHIYEKKLGYERRDTNPYRLKLLAKVSV